MLKNKKLVIVSQYLADKHTFHSAYFVPSYFTFHVPTKCLALVRMMMNFQKTASYCYVLTFVCFFFIQKRKNISEYASNCFQYNLIQMI